MSRRFLRTALGARLKTRMSVRETVKLKCHTFNFPPLHRTAPDMGTKGRDWHCRTKTDDHDDEARLAALALVGLVGPGH